MIRLFRTTTILYYSLLAVGTVIALLVYHQQSGSALLRMLVIVLLLLLFYFLASMISSFIATRKLGKITAMMTEECKIVDYIEAITALLRTASMHKRKAYLRIRSYLQMNLSSGYLNHGDLESAKQVLDDVDVIKDILDDHMSAEVRIFYHNNMIIYNLRSNDIENAKEHLEHFAQALKNPKLNETSKNWIPLCHVQRKSKLPYRNAIGT